MIKFLLKLSTKTMLMMGVAIAILVVVLYALSTFVVHQGFLQLEEHYARQNVTRVLRTIDESSSDLSISVADWAVWDDTYNFIQDRNTDYIEANLSPDSLKLLKINILLFLDNTGKLIWDGAYDLEKSEEMLVPNSLARWTETNSPLTRFGPECEAVSGLIMLDEGPLLVAAGPILTTKGEGPSRGAVIMGRYLNTVEIQRLSSALQLKLSTFRADALPDLPSLGETLATLSGGKPFQIRALDSRTLAGYGLVRDLTGRPAVIIGVEMPRDIFAQGQRTTALFTAMLVLVGLFFSVFVVIMLRRHVISRLEKLSRDIDRISMTENFSQRVLFSGADELSAVACNINRLLERVVESRQALVKSEERFRIVANYTVDWESWVGADGSTLWVSPSVERFLGYSADECIAMPGYPIPLIYEQDRPLIKQFCQKAMEGGVADNVEFRFVRKDGAIRWGAVSFQPVFDSQGLATGYRSSVRDITERKHAEDEIRRLTLSLEQRVHDRTAELEQANEQLRVDIVERQRAEERIRKLSHVQASLFDRGTLQEKIKKITDGIVEVFDADVVRIWLVRPGDLCRSGCIHADVTEGPHVCRNRNRCLHLVSSSGRYTRVDGETHRRVPMGCYKMGLIASGENSDFLTNDVTNDPRIHNHEWAKELGLVSFAGYRLRLPHDATIGVMALFSKHRLSAEEDALLKSFSNLVVLVTQTAQTEDALRESEQRFATSFHESPIAMAISSLADGKYVDVNDAFARDIGYAPKEVIGNTSLALDFYVDVEDEKRLLATALKYGYVTGQEINCRIATGQTRACLISMSVVSIGGQQHQLSSILDITERKQMEIDLLEAKQAAENASRAKSEFLSRVSHELRTPLNAILGFGQLLEMDQLDTKSNHRVKQILDGGRHLLNLINEILDLARIETGRLSISPEPVLVSEVVQETLDLIRSLADKRQIQVEKDTSFLDQWILADRQRLKQVLFNLLNNAIKYNREGGQVTVGGVLIAENGIENVKLKERVTLSKSSSSKATLSRSLRLFIRDTGPGIPAELYTRLFQPFERFVLGKSEMQGSGLGLALSKGFVEAMGGTIGVESVVGQGSTFWIELPIVGNQAEQIKLQAKSANPTLAVQVHDKTVLYVEDNVANLKLVDSILSYCPRVKMLTAMQGSMALEIARANSPDLILLDLHLPDLDGDEVLRQLQADPRTQDIPVVVLSADMAARQQARLRAIGARHVLEKPIDVTKFLDMLNNIFQMKISSQETNGIPV